MNALEIIEKMNLNSNVLRRLNGEAITEATAAEESAISAVEKLIEQCKEARNALSDAEVILRLASLDRQYMPVSGQSQKRASAAFRSLGEAMKAFT